MIRSLKFGGTAQIDAFLVFFYCYVQVCIECRRKNAKDAAMEECQAVVTRIPLPLPLLWRCRCYGVASQSVAAVSLLLARHSRAARSNSNTPPLLVLRTKQKSTKSRTIPNQKQSHKILVDLIKTAAVKTSWEKHLLVGKRVPTHVC